MPRTAAPMQPPPEGSPSVAWHGQDTAAALESALSALRERVAVVDDIVARSPARYQTPLGSPAAAAGGTPPMAAEQDARVQTTVLTDEQIAQMVAGGPSAPSSASKMRGLGARLASSASSLIALSPAREAAASAATSAASAGPEEQEQEQEEPSPRTEQMRLENCRERGLPEAATWNDIADHDMALSPQEIEQRRKDTVGRLLQLATAPDEDLADAVDTSEAESDAQSCDDPFSPIAAPEPEVAHLLDSFQAMALATPDAIPTAGGDSTPPGQVGTPEAARSPECNDSMGSDDSFGSVQSGSFLGDSSPVPAEPVQQRVGAGRRRGGEMDAALEMLNGTPPVDYGDDDYEDKEDGEEEDDASEEQAEQQAEGIPWTMDISMHSFVPPPERGEEERSDSLSPSMVAAQCVLDGDHIGARLALASAFSGGNTESNTAPTAVPSPPVALEDSFAMAEAEALQQAEASFTAKQGQLEDSFAAAEAAAQQSPSGDAMTSAFGSDFGQLVAEAREMVGSSSTGQRVVSPASAPRSPQQPISPHCVAEEPAAAGSTSPVADATPAATAEGPSDLKVGDRCEVVLQGARKVGSICYLGAAPLLGIGEWAGIELDDACGKHDGSVQGKRYFKCTAKHGVMLKRERAMPIGQAQTCDGTKVVEESAPVETTWRVTRSQTAAAASSNRFVQRASKQVQLAAADPTSSLHAAEDEEDFSVLVAEARQLAGDVELSDLRRPIMSPAGGDATPAVPAAKVVKRNAAAAARRRSSVDAAAATAAANAAAAAAAAVATPEHAAETEAELYLLKRKLRMLWKDMGRQSLRRVLRRSCPSGEVHFDDFLQSLRIGGHINARSLSDLELRRLYKGAKLELSVPGTVVNSHDITPLAIDALVGFLGLESTHAEPKQKKTVADVANAPEGGAGKADAVAAASAAEGDVDFKALLREARELIGAIPVVKSPPTATATVATAAIAQVRGSRSKATATARVAVSATVAAAVDHSKPKQRRPLSAPKQRYEGRGEYEQGRATSTARSRSRGPVRSRTPDARRPASSTRAASRNRSRPVSATRTRPSTAPAPPAAATPAPAEGSEEVRGDASPQELTYADRAVADAQRRQAWIAKKQEQEEERSRTAASGRPGGKPVRKRSAAAQARFLEQMDQNEQSRKERLAAMKTEATQEMKAKVLK